MLGVCGGEQDVTMLEEMLQSQDRRQKAGLDALVACYLILKGPAGMPLVEELFLINPKAEYADTYAAIMALRFHGTDTTVISKDRLLQGFRHMLKRPQLADLVIPDLARWEDWSCMDELVDLFKNADDKSENQTPRPDVEIAVSHVASEGTNHNTEADFQPDGTGLNVGLIGLTYFFLPTHN